MSAINLSYYLLGRSSFSVYKTCKCELTLARWRNTRGLFAALQTPPAPHLALIDSQKKKKKKKLRIYYFDLGCTMFLENFMKVPVFEQAKLCFSVCLHGS